MSLAFQHLSEKDHFPLTLPDRLNLTQLILLNTLRCLIEESSEQTGGGLEKSQILINGEAGINLGFENDQ